MSEKNSKFEAEQSQTQSAHLFDKEKYQEEVRNVIQDVLYNKHNTQAIIEKFRESLFPLLIRCLKQSEDYKKALEGQPDEPYASVALDFGNVFEFGRQNLFAWWFMHGNKVFGEFEEFNKIHVFSGNILPKSAAFKSNLLISVPLSLRRKDAIKQFSQIFDQKTVYDRLSSDIPPMRKRQLYPDQRLRKQTIENMLNVWELHKADRIKPWWQIGEELKISPELIVNHQDDEDTIKHKNRMMTLTVQRLHRMAGKLIDFAARGDFPRVK